MTTSITESQVNQPQSNDDVVLSVQGLSKKFCRSLKSSLFYGMQDIASELIGARTESNELRDGEFWALKDVSFELKKGESLGLVGANGSGKTTLLRIISGLIKPDTGSIKITGRVAPLIALGAGFNTILTGRENIYVNMSILGLSREEIDEKFDEVVEFAEIGNAIDAPVQTYSSGMAARLGFACAIHTEPDILLIDEVLAVGDIKFRTKCQNKLYRLRNESKASFVFVSHNSNAISVVCSNALYLKKGKVISLGNTLEIIHKYEEEIFLEKATNKLNSVKESTYPSNKNQDLELKSVFFRDIDMKVIDSPISGEFIILCIKYQVNTYIENVGFIISCKDFTQNQSFLYLNSWDQGIEENLIPGNYELQIQMPYFGLGLGLYEMSIALRKDKLFRLDFLRSLQFKVLRAKNQSDNSLFYQPYNYKLNIINSI